MTHALEEGHRLLTIAQADKDAFQLLAATPHIRLAIAMFLAQQAVEKALKAAQFAYGIPARRTHDLVDIAASLLSVAVLPFSPQAYARLSPYAVEFRYDELDIQLLTLEQAAELVDGTLAWAKDVLTAVETASKGKST